ncbi:hypothetical protein UPYG_G00040600 [Umbra pygmaea]|uniref:Immunoglobulin V-set domain-containing protein n=1 Tax=Umbra pygmaea TaxID=75934 RepID=A0ABD0XPY4_UMBPY
MSALLSYSQALGAECIGEHTYLPCIVYDGDLASGNVSVDWRSEREVVYRSVWAEGNMEPWNGSHKNKQVSANAPQMGNFSLEVSEVAHSDSQNYSLYLVGSRRRVKPSLHGVSQDSNSFLLPDTPDKNN